MKWSFVLTVAFALCRCMAFDQATDDIGVFVEEVGEEGAGAGDFITIDREILPSPSHTPRFKRQAEEAAAGSPTLSDATPTLPSSLGGGDQEGSGNNGLWDLEDDDFSQTEDGAVDASSSSSKGLSPSRPLDISPTLLSPSFEDTEVVASRSLPSLERGHAGSTARPIPQSSVGIGIIKSSIINSDHYDEIEEGSGNEAYDYSSSIVPSRPAPLPPAVATKSGVLGGTGDDDDDDGFVEPTMTFTPFGRDKESGSKQGRPGSSVQVATDRTENRKPYVQKKLPKFPVTAGKSMRIVIPEDTFFDKEDGNTRKLRLDLRHENGSVIRNTWLRFVPKKQALYALPVSENIIGVWKFRLIAMDREGKSASTSLEIRVRQYRRSRLVNHQFNIEFSFTDWDPASTRDWQWMMLNKVQRLYGDRKPTNIIVRRASENPFVFGWINNTLTQQSCPQDEIQRLYNFLLLQDDDDEDDQASTSNSGGGGRLKLGKPSAKLKTLLGTKIFAKSVSVEMLGTCLTQVDSMAGGGGGGGSIGSRGGGGSSGGSLDIGMEESVPQMRNPIDNINVTAGELLRYKVPADTCYDKEDGGTRFLNLELLTVTRKQLSPDFWLQFETRNQEFVGIPLEEKVGRSEYQLVCSDRSGLSAVDSIQVIVHNRPYSESHPIEFAFTFGDYSGFASRKVHIVEMIAAFFGDDDNDSGGGGGGSWAQRNVVVKTFDVDENRIVWFNKSMVHLACDDPQLEDMKDRLLEKDGKIKPALIQAFQPYLNLIDVEAIKRNRCAYGSVPISTTDRNQRRGGSGGGSDRGLGEGGTYYGGLIPSTDYLLTFIIPAVIITCMLILAILLACLLHKKRKAGKLNLFYSESLPPRVPVILQDELYETDHHAAAAAGSSSAAAAAGFKQPVMLPEDNMHSRPHHQISGNGGGGQSHEMDRLLQRPVAPLSMDPFSKGNSLSRPTPAYQRRQQM